MLNFGAEKFGNVYEVMLKVSKPFQQGSHKTDALPSEMHLIADVTWIHSIYIVPLYNIGCLRALFHVEQV